MERNELLRKINTFPIIAASLAKDLLAGDFRSVFRGEGIEFDEVRLYEMGDDIRSIDRNVSARYGKPYVKLYREERELTVFVALDCSASMFSGCAFSASLNRYEQALLVSTLVAFSAERGGQRLGALLFDSEMRHIFKPKKGRSHILSFTEAALQLKPLAGGTDLAAALGGINKLLKKRSLVLIVSDFLSTNWENELGKLSEKHDCIACRISDSVDGDFPNIGLVSVEDPETRKQITFDSGSQATREAWRQWNLDRAAFFQSICRKTRTAHLEISTSDEAQSLLKSFFRSRKPRR